MAETSYKNNGGSLSIYNQGGTVASPISIKITVLTLLVEKGKNEAFQSVFFLEYSETCIR